jgi:hypothetical protein
MDTRQIEGAPEWDGLWRVGGRAWD